MTDEIQNWQQKKTEALVEAPKEISLPPLSEFILANIDEAATVLGMLDKEKNKNYLKELIEHEKKNPSGNLFKILIRTREDLIRPLVNEMNDYQILPTGEPVWETFKKTREKYLKDPNFPPDLCDVMIGTIQAEKSWVTINTIDNINVVVADLICAFSPNVTSLENTAVLQGEIQKLKEENMKLATQTDAEAFIKMIDASEDKFFLENVRMHWATRSKELGLIKPSEKTG